MVANRMHHWGRQKGNVLGLDLELLGVNFKGNNGCSAKHSTWVRARIDTSIIRAVKTRCLVLYQKKTKIYSKRETR